jgi:uncharacterized membrane protein YdbT with pleckstrin-like domain
MTSEVYGYVLARYNQSRVTINSGSMISALPNKSLEPGKCNFHTVRVDAVGAGLASHQTFDGISWIGGGIFLSCLFRFLAIVSALQAIIVIFTTEFAVTDKRVIAKTGFIRKHTLEMLLQKIESDGINQDITGRMMNYGTVMVTGTGGIREKSTAIAAPLAVRKVINEFNEKSTQLK